MFLYSLFNFIYSFCYSSSLLSLSHYFNYLSHAVSFLSFLSILFLHLFLHLLSLKLLRVSLFAQLVDLSPSQNNISSITFRCSQTFILVPGQLYTLEESLNALYYLNSCILKKLSVSVAVPPAPVRVPSRRPLAPSVVRMIMK